jgi:hemolysin III
MTITIREPGSAFTHLLGMILAIFASTPLLIKAAVDSGKIGMFAMCVFMTSMILLYGASTLYHSVNLSGRKLKLFRKIDHMMIFVLIAGTYTPVCLLVLGGFAGQGLLVAVWALAIIGIVIKAFWIHCPKWFSSVIYIGMGWTCLACFKQILEALETKAFIWLLIGGIIYTLGGIVYSLKIPGFDEKHKKFNMHDIFHLFVMGGSLCHFIFIYFFVI